MNTENHTKFLFSLGVVGVMIVLALGQLTGNIWFHKAKSMSDRGVLKTNAMERALNVQPSHSFYWFSVGREFNNLSIESGVNLIERRRLLEKAEKYLKRAISLEPTASLYHYHLGWVYVALSPYRPSVKVEAHNAFQRALLLNPTNTDFRWGVANYHLNQYALSLRRDTRTGLETDIDWTRRNFQRHFRAYLEMRPPREVSRVLDQCFAVTQEYDHLREVIPDQPTYHFRLAQFLNQKGMWSLAKKEFELAISQDGSNPDAYHTYGSALLSHEDYQEALEMWKKEQAISPENPRSYLVLSKTFWTLKRKDEAIAELERLVSIHPDRTSYRLTLATRLEGARRPEQALKVYQDALKKDPENHQIYVQMASYWTRQKDFSEAEVALSRAISLKPSVIGYRDQLARLYFQQKRYSRAIHEWEDVLREDPKFMGAINGIARSYEEMELWGQAVRYYRQALTLNPDDESVQQKIKAIEKRSEEGTGRS